MGGYAQQVALVVGLVLLNAAFAGTEIALISLREGQLRRLEEHGRTGATLARLARDPNRFLATVQIGITLAGFLASATAAVTLAEPLVGALGFLGRAARPAAIVIVTTVLSFFTLVVGELAPKRVAMQRAERWGLVAARPLAGLSALSRPAVWLLSHATDLTVQLMGADPDRRREDVSEEEVRDLITTQRLYTRPQRRIITGALELSDRTLREVLIPRPAVTALPADVEASEALARLADAGHNRAPVYEETLDDAHRIIAALDLVGASGRVGEHANEAIVLPEAVAVIDALRALQQAHQQMALIVSEHGGVEGLVTVEDLVEEIVGEIHDEFDRDVRRVVRHGDGSLTVAGGFPVHDLEDLDVELPPGEYVTVAGVVLDALGHLPEQGEEVQVGDWRLVVDEIDGRRVRRLSLHPAEGGGE